MDWWEWVARASGIVTLLVFCLERAARRSALRTRRLTRGKTRTDYWFGIPIRRTEETTFEEREVREPDRGWGAFRPVGLSKGTPGQGVHAVTVTAFYGRKKAVGPFHNDGSASAASAGRPDATRLK